MCTCLLKYLLLVNLCCRVYGDLNPELWSYSYWTLAVETSGAPCRLHFQLKIGGFSGSRSSSAEQMDGRGVKCRDTLALALFPLHTPGNRNDVSGAGSAMWLGFCHNIWSVLLVLSFYARTFSWAIALWGKSGYAVKVISPLSKCFTCVFLQTFGLRTQYSPVWNNTNPSDRGNNFTPERRTAALTSAAALDMFCLSRVQ